MFYDRFLELCAKKGVKPTNACIEAGLSRGLAAKWKSTKTEKPSAEALEKMSAYFEMSINEILSGEKEKTPTPEGERELPHANYREVLAEDGIKLLLDADSKLPKEHLDEIVDFIKFKQQKYGR